MPSSLPCLATTTPGLEPLLAAELAALGVAGGATIDGGVEFEATPATLARTLIQLRTAHRVVVRLASFRARTFAELERHASKVDWGAVTAPGIAIHFRVTSRKSRLYHQDAIAERLERAVLGAVKGTSAIRQPSEAEELESDVTRPPAVQRFVVRVHRDEVTISADASGALLHRRGWRRDVAKAPLRETLAAAMLLGVEWSTSEPLHDPFCGSGTIAIEAALMARRIAPGIARHFAVESWPMLHAAVMDQARSDARGGESGSASVSISGSDRDPGAIKAAIANAERAGVATNVRFERATISELASMEGPGLLITNPPYGVRVGEANALRDLYATLARVWRGRRPDWRLAMLSANPMLEGQMRVKFRERWQTTNGGISVRLIESVHRDR
jgi:putative N6-adenine-specific DNA methylase